jgi:hypothetical protein
VTIAGSPFEFPQQKNWSGLKSTKLAVANHPDSEQKIDTIFV